MTVTVAHRWRTGHWMFWRPTHGSWVTPCDTGGRWGTVGDMSGGVMVGRVDGLSRWVRRWVRGGVLRGVMVGWHGCCPDRSIDENAHGQLDIRGMETMGVKSEVM